MVDSLFNGSAPNNVTSSLANTSLSSLSSRKPQGLQSSQKRGPGLAPDTEEKQSFTVLNTFIHVADTSAGNSPNEFHSNGMRRSTSDGALLGKHLKALQNKGADSKAPGSQIDNRQKGRDKSSAATSKKQITDTRVEACPEAPPPSVGSQKHSLGECKPCVYDYKDKCVAGYNCMFCHYPHAMPKRPGKNTRRRNKARQVSEATAAAVAAQDSTAQAILTKQFLDRQVTI